MTDDLLDPTSFDLVDRLSTLSVDGVGLDATELLRQGGLFAAVLDQLPVAVWIAEAPSGRLLFGNKRIAQIWGHEFLPADDISGYEPYRGEHPDGRPVQPHEWPLARACATGEIIPHEELDVVRPDGTRLRCLFKAGPILDRHGNRIAGVVAVLDISKRHEAEVALEALNVQLEGKIAARTRHLEEALDSLKQSEARLRTAISSSPIGMALLDLEGRWLTVNDALCALVGYSPEELQQLTFRDITYPEDLDKDLAEVQHLLSGEKNSYQLEKRYVHKEGHLVPILLAGAIVRDDAGRPQHFIAQIVDFTEVKRAEEKIRAYMNQLSVSNRELQEFTHVASHDLQEPMRKIRSMSALLLADFGDQIPAEARDFLQRMSNAANRMQVLISDLLTLARVSTRAQAPTPVDLNKVVATVLEDLSEQLRTSGATVKVDPLPTLDADPTQMRQLLQNLLSNSLKYRKEAAPTIQIRQLKAAPAHCAFEVEDDGEGFDERYLDRIFQPFQRLVGRSQVPGTGMGLAICKKIIERHHGTITARSAPGRGATFIVTLPLHPPLTERTP